MVEPRTLKGFRDFLPREARKRQYVIETLKKAFELYGFEPLETPVLEYEEILAGKYGDEGEKLMYRFTDNGDRRVAMRYDQTVPLARVVAQYGNTSLPLPFKRYQIQNVWRAENTQKGRFREFIQCDIDTIGTTSEISDAEILAIVSKVYTQLGFSNIKIVINDRSIFQGLDTKAILIIDKLKKIGEEAVIKELATIGVSQEQFENIKNAQPTVNLQMIISSAQLLGVPETALQFDPTLARGLDYYTGLIFEIICDDYPVGSLGGGGRYDNLIGMFQKNSIPAVGCAVGFDRTIEAMDTLNLFPSGLSTTNVLVTIFSPEYVEQSLGLAEILRKQSVNTEIYLDTSAKMDKQLKYANKKNIPFVLILGPDEIKKEMVTVKNMSSGEQKTVIQKDILQNLS
jgi:histidyl-tRNA synthetase